MALSVHLVTNETATPADSFPMSIIVPVLNEEVALRSLLGILTAQMDTEDELIVVDGGSSDGTISVVQEVSVADQRVRLLVASGTNIPQARNAGVTAAKHDRIACTDAGCVPADSWLDALRSTLSDPSVDLATGVYSVAEKDAFESAMAAACYPDIEEALDPDALSRWSARLFGRSFDAAMPTGRSVAFTRRAWASVGGFPEHLATAEDVTFGLAIVQAGGSAILVPEALVEWEQRPTAAATARMYYRYGYGDALSGDTGLILRNLGRLAAYSFAAYALTHGSAASRLLLAAGGAAYLAAPLRRASRRPSPALVAVGVIPTVALKDLSKAVGCAVGIAARSLRAASATAPS